MPAAGAGTAHPAYQAVTAVRGRAVALWKGLTLPYPEPGVRLIRQDDVEPFNQRLLGIREELAEGVNALDRAYSALREAARERLGRLYNPSDYPASLQGLFAIEWDFPSVEPPDYLRRLNPELYAQEQRRIAGRFDQAVQLAEEAFTAEFGKLVGHLTERLSGGGGGASGGGGEGKPKVFRDSAVVNLRQFFERFRGLNIHSNAQLDELVEQAQAAVRGIGPQALRDSQAVRDQVAKQLATVQSQLDDLMVERPRRRILRTGHAAREADHSAVSGLAGQTLNPTPAAQGGS